MTENGFATLFSNPADFLPNSGVFDPSAFLSIIVAKPNAGDGAYVTDLSGQLVIGGITQLLRNAVDANPFGNRNPQTGTTAADPHDRANYGVTDGFFADDLIFVPTNGMTITLNLGVDSEYYQTPLNNPATGANPETVNTSSTTNYTAGSTTTTITKQQVTALTNISQTVTAPLLIRMANAYQTGLLGIPPPPMFYTTVTGFNLQTGDKHGTATVGSTNYNVFMLTSTTTTYTMNFSAASASNIYMLVVGAGGGAASCSGGGGGGAVVMATVPVTAESGVITVHVGAGRTGNDGYPSTVQFSGSYSTYNVTANGGGSGKGFTSNGNNGGSGGGGGSSSNTSGGTAVNPTYSFATVYGHNGGGGRYVSGGVAGGGGGAGAAGQNQTSTQAGNGGDGVACSLPGIAQFTPTGLSALGTYYWGGGGGGAAQHVQGGNGGKGGGGGGGVEGGGHYGTGGSNSLVSYNGTTHDGGNGGKNTGGGAGGSWYQGSSHAGGSGIVVIAFS